MSQQDDQSSPRQGPVSAQEARSPHRPASSSFLASSGDDYSGLRTTPGLKITGTIIIASALAVVVLAVSVWTLFQPSRALNIGKADTEPVGRYNEQCPLEPGMVRDLYAQSMTTHFYLAIRRGIHWSGFLAEQWRDRFGTHELLPEIAQSLAFPPIPETFVEARRFDAPADEYLAGVLELYGIEVAVNESRGLSRIRAAARKGYTPAIRHYALLLSSLDDHLPENFELMLKLAHHAGNCGDRTAYAVIVRHIEKTTPGNASPVHKLMLSSWYRKAGLPIPKGLGENLAAGPAPAVKRPKQVSHRESSDQNIVTRAKQEPYGGASSDGVQNLKRAKALELGTDGLAKDPAKALALYRAEADKDNPRAQVALGEKYLAGEGVAKNPAVARQWFEKAALLGDAEGAARLGSMFLDATGGPRELNEAEKWLRYAADNGHVNAMRDLIMVYKLTGKTAERERLEAQLKTTTPAPASQLAH